VRVELLRGEQLLLSVAQPLPPAAMNADGTVPFTLANATQVRTRG
jgi:hypothetical protein